MLCDVIFGGHGCIYICLKYLGPWESEKTGDLYCKNDLFVTGKQRQVILSDDWVLFKLFSRIAFTFAAFSFKPHYYHS